MKAPNRLGVETVNREAYVKTVSIWAGGGLAVNFAWEMLHMPFFAGAEVGWWRCFVAALGDVAILGLLYVLMACAAEDWLWCRRLSLPRAALLAALGALVAAVVELHALGMGKWSYAAGMPRVPFLGIGWLPVLQMTLIPIGLTWLSSRWAAPAAVRIGGG